MDHAAYNEKRAGAAKALQKIAAAIGDRDGLDVLQKVFDEFDVDGSGGLDPDELQQALEVMRIVSLCCSFDLLRGSIPHSTMDRSALTRKLEGSSLF
jgi:hypothetical protein